MTDDGGMVEEDKPRIDIEEVKRLLDDMSCAARYEGFVSQSDKDKLINYIQERI